MAVTKLWSVKSNLKQVIDYAVNPEKTAADVYTEEQYQALADVLSYAKDEEKRDVNLYKLAIVELNERIVRIDEEDSSIFIPRNRIIILTLCFTITY